jgi:Tol biopolymer transport system component
MKIMLVIITLLICSSFYGEKSDMDKKKEKFFNDLNEKLHQEKMLTENMIYFGDRARYSPDGKYIAFQVIIKNIGYIYLFDCKTEKVIKTFWGNYFGCDNFMFNRKGDKLIFMTEYWLNKEHTEDNFFLQEMNLEGKNRQILLRPKQSANNPIFSQDDKTIYFAEYLSDGDRLHYTKIYEGKDEILINTNLGEISRIVLLADGSNIIFTAGGGTLIGEGKIYNYNLNKNELRPIYTNFVKLVYSDNYEREILIKIFEKPKDNIYKLNLDSGKKTFLFSLERNNENWNYDLTLSPDGKKIVYTGVYIISKGSRTNLIMEVNIDGSGTHPLPIDLKKLNEVPMVNIDEGFDWKK